MSGPEVITLGCRLNAAESEAMRALAGGEDDLVIVNSCAVTNEAVRQTRQAIRRAKRARPEARVVVTGCAAQVEPETFAAMPEVARVLGNREKFDPRVREPSLPATGSARDARSPTSWRCARPRRISSPASPSARAPSSRCRTAATIAAPSASSPTAAGTAARVPAGLVVERIKALVGEGFREVVLTGVDVTSYGPDLPGAPTLGLLVERILQPRAGAAAAAAVLARLHRDRRAAVRASSPASRASCRTSI